MSDTKAVRPPHVERFRGKDGWYLRLVGANGRKVYVTEAYSTKWNAKRAHKIAFSRLKMIDVSK